VEIRPPEFWVYQILYTSAKHVAHCNTNDIELTVNHLLEEYAKEQTAYIGRHMKSVAVLVDGVATQVPVTDMKLSITLDLSKLRTDKTLKVSFGSKLHELLYGQKDRKPYQKSVDSKDIARLQGAGLIDLQYLTPKGEKLLEQLFEEGPQNGHEVNRLCQSLLTALTNSPTSWSHEMLPDYLFEKKYLDFSSGSLTLTAKGVKLLKDNASRLMTLRGFQEWQKDLVPFLPTEQLPIYIASEDPKVREAATKRHKEFEEVLNVHSEEV